RGGVVYRPSKIPKMAPEQRKLRQESRQRGNPADIPGAAVLGYEPPAGGEPVMDVSKEARVIADPVERGIAENKLELRPRLCSKKIALDEIETALKTPQIPSSLLEHLSRNIQADHARFGKLSQQVRCETATAAPGIQDSEVARPGNL